MKLLTVADFAILFKASYFDSALISTTLVSNLLEWVHT